MMGRVFDEQRAGQFKGAFHELPSGIKRSLIDGLNVDGLSDGVAIIPYYAPGLLAIAIKNTVNTDTRLVRVLTAFMRFLARVLDDTRPRPGEEGVIIERDLSFAGDVAGSESFQS